MMKKFLKIAFVIAIIGTGIYSNHRPNTMPDLLLANVEALANIEDERGYETRTEDSIEVWDEVAQVYKKIVTINCEGKGSLDC